MHYFRVSRWGVVLTVCLLCLVTLLVMMGGMRRTALAADVPPNEEALPQEETGWSALARVLEGDGVFPAEGWPMAVAQPTEWTVCASGCDFTLLSEALADARVVDGDALTLMDSHHTEAEIHVGKNIYIQGQGASTSFLQASEQPPSLQSGGSPLLVVLEDTTVVIANLTLRHGYAAVHYSTDVYAVDSRDDGNASVNAAAIVNEDVYGAGILVIGDLILYDSVVRDNSIAVLSSIDVRARAAAPLTRTAEATAQVANELYGRGAGIFNAGTLYMYASTVMDNKIVAYSNIYAAAGVNEEAFTSTVWVSSTVHALGAGIYNAGHLQFHSSTIGRNEALAETDVVADNDMRDPLPASQEAASVSRHAWFEEGDGWQAPGPRALAPEAASEITTSGPALSLLLPLPQTPIEGAELAATLNQAVGGIYNAGWATGDFVTFSENEGQAFAAVEAQNVILAREWTGAAYRGEGDIYMGFSNSLFNAGVSRSCGGSLIGGWVDNMANDPSCPFFIGGAAPRADMGLGALDTHGGQTPVYILLPGSPAIDAGETSCSSLEQRHYRRPNDGDGDGEARCDVGAVEAYFAPELALRGAVMGERQKEGEPPGVMEWVPGEVTPGGRVTHTWTISNEGHFGADVTLAKWLSPGFDSLRTNVSTTSGFCWIFLPTAEGQRFECPLGTLTPGDVATVTVSARAWYTATNGAALPATATAETVQGDLQRTSISGVLTTTVRHSADIQLTVTGPEGPRNVGEGIDYRVELYNAGFNGAPTVHVSSTMAAGFTYTAWTCLAYGGAQCSESYGDGNLDLEVAMPPGSTVLLLAYGRVASCGAHESQFWASSDLDSYTVNNSATALNGLHCLYLPRVFKQPLLQEGDR